VSATRRRLRHGLTLIDQAQGEDDLLGREFRLAAKFDAALLCGDASKTGAVANECQNECQIELGNAGEHGQHHLARRRRRIGPRLAQRFQAGAGDRDLLRQFQKVTR
jgi:hypothetical protein